MKYEIQFLKGQSRYTDIKNKELSNNILKYSSPNLLNQFSKLCSCLIFDPILKTKLENFIKQLNADAGFFSCGIMFKKDLLSIHQIHVIYWCVESPLIKTYFHCLICIVCSQGCYNLTIDKSSEMDCTKISVNESTTKKGSLPLFGIKVRWFL